LLGLTSLWSTPQPWQCCRAVSRSVM
jgi:hypothetical protein